MKKLRFFDSLKFVVAAIVCTFILNVANAATLPAGYTELEYIHFVNGVGNIKTGIIPTSSIEIELKASFESGYSAGLAYNTGLSTSSIKGVYWQGSTALAMNGRGASYAVANGSIQTVIQNRNNVIVNGRQYNYNGAVDDFVGINELFIGGINSNKFSGNIYSFIVRFNGVMERNFVPARRDIDGVLGMYDTVYMEFYTNQGSGSFTAGPDVIPQIKIATTRYNEEQFEPVQNRLSDAMDAVDDVVTRTMTQAQAIDQIANEKQTRPDEGCTAKYCLLVEDEDGTPHWYPIAGANGVEYVLPAGYTQLEYIESDGHSYLIVPYRVNNKTVFYARYNETQNGTSTASVVFGVTSTPDVSKANYGILRLLNGTSNFNRMGWGDSTSGSVKDVNAPRNLNTWYEVLYDQNKLYQDNVLYATSATSNDTEWVANYDLGIFARNGATVTMPAIAKISSVWAKEDGEYKINLVPAKDSSGVVGMYDMVSGQFFTNRGTGEFGEGPVVE